MKTHSKHINEINKQTSKSLFFALIITGSLTILEFIGGLISNSLALLSDAGHMLTDTFSIILTLSALNIATKPSTESKTFGYYRVEILAATINGSILFLISLYILYEAFLRFLNPGIVKGMQMLIIASFGLGGNVISLLFLKPASKSSLNIRGAFLHILSDTLSSIGVIAGGLIIIFTGWTRIDAFLGFIIAISIARNALLLVIESINILLEATPKDIDIDTVKKKVESMDGVKEIHDLHIWTITSGFNALSAHILIDDQTISKAGEISSKIKKLLEEEFTIGHTTLELECANCGVNVICDKETCFVVKNKED